jgi:hypothetical protein
MDPITPPPLAHAIMPGFSNGTYVEFPYAGHGPSRSVECAGDMLNAFFDDPSAEPDLRCVDEMEKPTFFAPLFTTTIGPRVMVRVAEDEKKLIGPGVWAGVSVAVPLVSFLVLTFAPVVRRIDRRQAAPAGRARLASWLAALLVVISIGTIGAAIGVTAENFEALLLVGLVPWARWGALAGVLAGIAGVAAIGLAVRARRRERLPIGSLVGFVLNGLAAASFCVFLLFWGLGPF